MTIKFWIFSSNLVLLAPYQLMKNHEISKKVETLLLEVLNIETLPINASTENIDEWDSLAYLSIVSKLEKKFKLKIYQENIDKFNSIKNIVKEIELCKKIKP